MDFTNYVGLIVLTFMGYIAGLVLPMFKSIKEELKPGKKYFVNFRNIAAALVFGVVFYYETTIIAAITATIILLAVFYKLKTLKPAVYYVLFALAISYSQTNQELLSIVTSIIFLTGLPLGTIQYIENKKNLIKGTIVIAIVYSVISISLFLYI